MDFFLSADKADLTYIIPACDSGRKIKFAAEAFGNATVTAHGMIAENADFFITAALLLPGFHQRTVMKINVEMIVCASFHIHFKYPLGWLGEQRLFQSLEGWTAAGLFAKIGSLIQASA